MKLRTKAKKLVRHEVGNGKSIFLWLDKWHMGLELSMMQLVLLRQHSAVYLKTRNGIGGLLGLKIWSRFEVNCNRQISKRIIE